MFRAYRRLQVRLAIALIGGVLAQQGCSTALPTPNELAADVVGGLIVSFVNQTIQQAINTLFQV
jgi:hypothetical protein